MGLTAACVAENPDRNWCLVIPQTMVFLLKLHATWVLGSHRVGCWRFDYSGLEAAPR